MKIIAFRDFDKSICGIKVHRGDEFTTDSENKVVCLIEDNTQVITCRFSQYYIEHFSQNDDGKGLLRGDLTYFLSHYYSFTDKQEHTLRTKWKIYLMPFLSTILFNDLFYDASIEILTEIIESLGMEVDKCLLSNSNPQTN